MILEEETFERFGYYPSELSPKSSKKILAACDDCGKVRVTSKNLYRSLCVSCCKKGKRYNNYREGIKGENNPNWRGGKIKRVCEACSKEFEVDPSIAKKGGGRFCSISCAKTGERSHNWQGEPVKRICETCGKEFVAPPSEIEKGRGRFCSKECYYEFEKNRIKRICEVCGKEFEVTPSIIKKGKGRFCSQSCARKKKVIPTHHTKPEMIFEAICKKYNLPFKYTGDSSFWIKNINPDFVECNGKKIAVEIFSYWHDPLRRLGKVRYSHTYDGRKTILKEYGWKLVVFWQEDLERVDAEQFVLSTLKKESIL